MKDFFQVPDSWIQLVKPLKSKGVLPLIKKIQLMQQSEQQNNQKKNRSIQEGNFRWKITYTQNSTNSVYDFTQAQVGQLPCLEISSTIPSYGREMIIQQSRQNGYPEDAQVYFGVKTVEEAMQLGLEAVNMITKCFSPSIKLIKLEFEKVYYPYPLINRKRYDGLLWTKPDKWEKIDQKNKEYQERKLYSYQKR